MGILSRGDPKNQYLDTQNPPPASSDETWKARRFAADQRLLQQADNAEARGDVGDAQVNRRIVGD